MSDHHTDTRSQQQIPTKPVQSSKLTLATLNAPKPANLIELSEKIEAQFAKILVGKKSFQG